MSCGPYSSLCCPRMSTRIAKASDDHGCRIETVPMPSSTCCEPEALGKLSRHSELCAHSTAHERFQEWVKAGVFLKLWQAGIEQFDELRGIDWDWLGMDGTMRHLLRWAGKKPDLIPPIGARAGSNAAFSRRDMECQSA